MTKRFRKLQHDHRPENIQKRLRASTRSLLKDFVYGGIDGAVTTFAIVAGVVGASLETRAILILGMANILADGFSMAASNYLGTKTELEEKKLIAEFEERQIDENPHGEKEEIRQIFLNKGLEGDVLETVVDQVTANRAEWLKVMLAEEYGLSHADPEPWKSGLMTFTSFVIFGMIPLLPYIFGVRDSFVLSSVATALAFIGIGFVKSRWTQISPVRSALETLFIGSAAAVLAYVAGHLIANV